MSKSIDNLKISISGVRGIVGETLSPRLVSTLSAAFGNYIGAGPVIISRDTRKSGIMVEQAVIAGLLSVGCQPILTGILPTPTLQIVVKEMHAAGGIAITASHNPPPWNALKFINDRGMFLNKIEAKQLLDIYNQDNILQVTEEALQEVKNLQDCFTIHQNKILANIDLKLLKKSKIKVAIDCGSGAAAPYAEKFLQKLGCKVIAINTNADGEFNRKLEPTPDALTELSKVVKKNKCQVGFAQDPDADRLVVVDEDGEILNENYTLALATVRQFQRNKGKVTISLATSKMIADLCKQNNCEIDFTKVGEINVSSEMLKNSSVIGGEANGGVIWPAIHPCRDSFAGMALILELIAHGDTIKKTVCSLPKYYFGTAKITTSGEIANLVINKLKLLYADMNPITSDGIRLDWEDRWLIIRASNTEPLIRLQGEALSIEVLEKMLSEFTKLCQKLTKG